MNTSSLIRNTESYHDLSRIQAILNPMHNFLNVINTMFQNNVSSVRNIKETLNFTYIVLWNITQYLIIEIELCKRQNWTSILLHKSQNFHLNAIPLIKLYYFVDLEQQFSDFIHLTSSFNGKENKLGSHIWNSRFKCETFTIVRLQIAYYLFLSSVS